MNVLLEHYINKINTSCQHPNRLQNILGAIMQTPHTVISVLDMTMYLKYFALLLKEYNVCR